MYPKRTYNISFGIEINVELEGQNNPNKSEIPINNVKIGREFPFQDYDLNLTIGNLKEYFLINYGQQLNYCKCTLFIYYKESNIYKLLSENENEKLSQYKHDNLYLIKMNKECNCQLKEYSKYMTMHSFDIIEELKKKIDQLENNIKDLKKEEELKIDKKPFEDFYDIIIDINSIRKVSTEGWKVQYSDKGLKKYNEFKNQDLIIIGVIGNNNKGKSFLLSKISKIKLLSGTSIETKGLSVKYPDLKGHQERQLILLDSAGLETPVLKTKKIEKEENKEKEDIIIEKEKKDEEIREDKEKEIKEDKEKKEENKEKEENISKKKSKNKGNQVDEEIKKIKEFRDNSSDKIITELFLQNFIVKASDVLLLVIGKLTYSEQKFLIKIKDECKKQNRKRIFIVHNLQDFIKTE